MTRATGGIRYISTTDLFARITTPQRAPALKSEHSSAMLARFGIQQKASDTFLLLDVRSCLEVERSGMILGAQVLPSYDIYYALTQPKERLLEMCGLDMPDKGDLIVCYADKGSRLGVAHSTLRYLGYHNVMIYKDGFDAFAKAYPHLIGRIPVEAAEKKEDAASKKE